MIKFGYLEVIFAIKEPKIAAKKLGTPNLLTTI